MRKRYKHSIAAADALKYEDKNVTICERVYSVRVTPAITQISLGAAYPNAPVTLVIFSSNYFRFSKPLAEWLTDKNICVKGKVSLYKGVAQVVVEKEGEIEVLQ